MMNCVVDSYVPLNKGRYVVDDIPGDKSISHRAIIVGALAENTSRFQGFLFSEDCLNTIAIFRALGCRIEVDEHDKTVTVHGVGLHGFQAPYDVLDVGNSGTSIRLISGVLVGQAFDTMISGDQSICRRPMRRIIDPLSKMGADISGTVRNGDVVPPLRIRGSHVLHGIEYQLPVASAQVKSSILFASLYSNTPVTVIEPDKCRDHTERLLQFYGAACESDGNRIQCSGRHALRCPTSEPLDIPADPSSAAFFMVLACFRAVPVTVKRVGLNPTRIKLMTVLQEMGADIQVRHEYENGVEPYGDIRILPSTLRNKSILPEWIPFLIDEIPILAVAGMLSKGVLDVSGAAELRVKESDRIRSISEMVRAFGGDIEEKEAGFVLKGQQYKKDEHVVVSSYGDHRIAMSSVIAGIVTGNRVTVRDCACINTSFPNFFDILARFGVKVTFEEGVSVGVGV